MDAREYLGQIKKMRNAIMRRQKHIDEMKYSYMGCGSLAGEADRVQTSPNLNGVYGQVDKVLDLERELEAEILDFELRISEIDRMIDRLGKPLYADIVRSKWVEGKSLEQISVDLAFSFPYIRRNYWRAMQEMQKITEKIESKN